MEAERKDSPAIVAPVPIGAALAARRRQLNLTRRELARRTRIRAALLAAIEAGRRPPAPKELARLAKQLQTTPSRLQAEGDLWAAAQGAPSELSLYAAAETLRWAGDFRSALIEHARALDLPAARPCAQEAGPERLLAEDSWRRLLPLSPKARKSAIGGDPLLAHPHFRRWGLAERLCLESEAALPADPRAALDLAELALHVAERVSGAPDWRTHLQGYAWAFVAKAKHAAGDRAGADEAATRAQEMWNPGCLDEPDFLPWPGKEAAPWPNGTRRLVESGVAGVVGEAAPQATSSKQVFEGGRADVVDTPRK